MNKNWLTFIIIILILIVAWFAVTWDKVVEPAPDVNPNPTLDDRVKVGEPSPNAVVASPLTVTGEAPGPWYFEASFPVELLDASGTRLAMVPAQAEGEWMTVEQVPFSVILTFATPATDTGSLILHRDNPSGLPENDAQVVIPIRFR